MATQTLAPDAREIYAAVTLRLEELRPLVEEYRPPGGGRCRPDQGAGRRPSAGPGHPPKNPK